MKCLVCKRADGGVTVIHPAIHEGETEADAIAVCLARSVPQGATMVTVVDVGTLPRRHPATRDAWEWDGATCTVNMVRARANCKARSARAGKPLSDVALSAALNPAALEALAEGKLE